jgi:hypothetical protein
MNDETAEEIILRRMEQALTSVEKDYSQLVHPENEIWKNILLGSAQLDKLRAQDVSWENGKIQFILREHLEKMHAVGVGIAKDEALHGFIVFRRITPLS